MASLFIAHVMGHFLGHGGPLSRSLMAFGPTS